MAFIEEAEQKVTTEPLTVKISVENKRYLEAYTKYRKSESVGWTLDQILGKVFKIDAEFWEYVAAHPDATKKSKTKAKPIAMRAAS